eukprot:9230004-Pyramimonas_sp.AAC.1
MDVVQVMWGNQCGAMYAGKFRWASYVVQLVLKQIDTFHALANISPTCPQLGLQNACGGDCDGCLALAGPFLRPRQLKHARAAAS